MINQSTDFNANPEVMAYEGIYAMSKLNRAGDAFQKVDELNPRFADLLVKVMETHISKSHDYATVIDPYSNFKQAAQFAGTDVNTVFNVLIGVKQARLEILLSEEKTPNNESIQDTYLDRAVYALLQAAYNTTQECK